MQVCKRINAVSSLLAARPPDRQQAISAAQAPVIVDLLRKGTYTTEELVEINTCLSASSFDPAAKEKIEQEIDRLAAAESPGAVLPAHGKTPSQNWETMIEFISRPVWDSLLKDQDPATLFDHLIALGLRNPTEPTKQVLACILMATSKGMQDALQLSDPMKTSMVKSTGALFSRHLTASRVPAPAVHIAVLPETPEALKAAHANVFNLVFAAAPAAPFPLDRLGFAELRRTTNMRSTKIAKASMPSASSAAFPWSGAGSAASNLDGNALVAALAQSLAPAIMQCVQPSTSLLPGLSFTSQQPQQPSAQQPSPSSSSSRLRALVDRAPTLQHLSGAGLEEAVVQDRTGGDDPSSQLAPQALADGARQASSQQASLQVAAGQQPSGRPPAPQAAPAAGQIDAASGSKRRLSVEEAAAAIGEAYASQKAARQASREAVLRKPAGAQPSSLAALPKITQESSRKQFLVRVPARMGTPGSKTFSYKAAGDIDNARAKAHDYCLQRCKDFGESVPDDHEF